jgi:hypothetical protein
MHSQAAQVAMYHTELARVNGFLADLDAKRHGESESSRATAIRSLLSAHCRVVTPF